MFDHAKIGKTLSHERIILLDPRGSLGSGKEALSGTGVSTELFSRFEDLQASLREPHPDPTSLVVVVDGDPESGLALDLSARLAELSPELPPIVVAVVRDRRRGRSWTDAGAGSFLERPVDPQELRGEVERWLHFTERLKWGANQVEALRRFFAMFAHDLKNPLSAISGYCELASAHPLLPGEAREDLEKVRRNIDLLSTMAQGLLEMVRGNSRLRIDPREVELTSVVKEAVAMMRVRAGARGMAIHLRAEAGPTLVRIDPPRFIEALANVLDNAIKFSPERSAVEVAIQSQGSQVLITIDDEGPGIPLSEREAVFEKFAHVSTQLHQGGLGLGLSIARDIVKLHRGAIWVEGRPSGGTRIVIRLPLASSEALEWAGGPAAMAVSRSDPGRDGEA